MLLLMLKYKTEKKKESRDGVPKSIQTRVVRMVTKVKGLLFVRLFICQALEIVAL